MGIKINGNTPTNIMYNGTEATLYYNGEQIWPERSILHHVILQQYAGGTVSANPMSGYSGDSVTFDATPNKFYALKRLYHSSPNGAWVYTTVTPFTTAFGNGNISAYASFQYTASVKTGKAYCNSEISVWEDYGEPHTAMATSAIPSGDIIVSASGNDAFIPTWSNSQLYWCNGDYNRDGGQLTYISGNFTANSGVYSASTSGDNVRLWCTGDAYNYSAIRYSVTG